MLLPGLLAFSAIAQEETCNLGINVFSYEKNTPIMGANLSLTGSNGARVGVNSFLAGKFDGLASGKYKIEIEKEGYERRTKEFDVKCGLADDEGVFLVSVYLGDAEKHLPAPQVKDGMGILTGVALNIPKPKYPAAMRGRERISRTVTVTVLIDEDGNVLSAKADDDSLFGVAASKAAMSAKFQPTRLSGAAVKVSGIVSYDFVP